MSKSEKKSSKNPLFVDGLFTPSRAKSRDYGDPKKAKVKRRIKDIEDKQAFEKLWGEL